MDRSVGGGSSVRGGRKLSDALKSKYKRFCDPPPPPLQPGNRTRREYRTPLEVYGNREVEDEPPLKPSFCPLIIKEKITNALMLMSFREQHLLVQFWSPIATGKRHLLTTLDQPFGLGVIDEGLYLYRSKSKQRVLVVDEEDSDELAPPARVYRQKLPEWSSDVHGSSTRKCVQDYAACFNIHGYINLPVFEPTSGSCVGILELITSASYVDFAFEVREVSRALKKVNLKSPNVFEDTRLYTQVGDERKHYELDEIFVALKRICDVQNLPLAQTWALAGCSSVVANSGNLEMSCSSFNKRCIGKVCMSTADLPYYVRDLSTWEFYEACRERHIDKLQGVVGRSLSARGLCFCGDVSNLSDYPLAPYALESGITSSLAVYLKSVETDVEYVIELFLPPHSENKAGLQSVVKSLLKTVRQLIKNSSGVQLGIMSSPEVIGGIPLHWNSESPSSTEQVNSPPDSGDERPFVKKETNDVDVPFSENQNEVANVKHVEKDNLIIQPSNSAVAVTRGSFDPRLEVGTEYFYDNPWKTRRKYDKRWRKRKRSERTISLVELSKHYGKTIHDAAVSLSVGRSTLKRICRSYGMLKWPYENGYDKNGSSLKQDQTVVAVHVSEEFRTPVFGASIERLDTNDTTFNRATLNKHNNLGSTLVPHQPVQTNLPDKSTQPHTTVREKSIENIEANTVEKFMIKVTYRKELFVATHKEEYVENVAANTVKNLMIKEAYGKDTLKFQFNLSDGLEKLKELVAASFQLKLGSFKLKYVDEDDDLILIAIDEDLKYSLSTFKQPNIQTLIRLLVFPIPQSSDASTLSNLSHSSAGSVKEKYIENRAANTVENLMIKAAYRKDTDMNEDGGQTRHWGRIYARKKKKSH